MMKLDRLIVSFDLFDPLARPVFPGLLIGGGDFLAFQRFERLGDRFTRGLNILLQRLN